jgi:hypothetical protein
MIVGVILFVLGLTVLTAPTLAEKIPAIQLPPWTVVQHGDVWSYSNGEGHVSPHDRFTSRIEAQDHLQHFKRFAQEWNATGRKEFEAWEEAQKTPGFWTAEDGKGE